MKFHYAGKYNGDENSLPQREHPTGYVQFREPKNMKTFAVIVNIMSFVIVFTLLFLASAVAGKTFPEFINIYGIVVSVVSIIPHEFLHALCFNGDVYMYQNLKQSMMFVVGTEDMSKGQFIFMSLCPNIVFGFIPFILFLIFPDVTFLGTLGAFGIGMGAGDYVNIFNCITQVPKGAEVYMSGMHTYWHK